MKSYKKLFDKERTRDFFRLLNERGKLSAAYLILCSNADYSKETVLEIASDLIEDADSIKRIRELSHPDVIWLEAENKTATIKIDSIRYISSKVNLKPYEAKRKVIIINNASDMNEAAQNAFLKTLEEPPCDTVIFLLSREIIGFLETIISRCKIIRLSVDEFNEDGEFTSETYTKTINDFINVRDNDYSSFFNFEDKNIYRQILKTLYCFFRDAACLKKDITDKDLLLTDVNQVFLEYISKLNDRKITAAIEMLDKMYRYSMANVNLRLSQVNTAQSFKEIMES
jgi:hypothetical protein